MWKFLRVSNISEYKIKCVTKHTVLGNVEFSQSLISEYKIKCVTKHTVLGKMMDMREVRDTHRWEVRRWGYRWR